MHPYFGNEAVRTASASYDVAVEAWSPIAQGAVLDDPTITRSPSASTGRRRR